MAEGIQEGFLQAGKDFLKEIYDFMDDFRNDPGKSIEGTIQAIKHPIETYDYLSQSIADSFERDVINGDAESRAKWISYALGNIVLSAVGTKGLGAVSKTVKATSKVGVHKVKGAAQKIPTLNLYPYAPQHQLAGVNAGIVPYNTVNSVGLRDQLISMAKVEAGGSGKGTDYKYWNKITEFKNVKVYQRDDIIDPNMKDAMGRTNLERMKKGLAPLGSDGKSINLHHTTQRNTSSIAEVIQTFHKENSSVIHINPNAIPSGINRKEFNKWRTDYWKNRANNF
ncbi:HNH/ENDO VII family nuclease [Rummeliibacillus suwonensis]|uniref:HNH/ENDO VII family nuclease n=2 Tax=Rummeliibacillus suwonensis TaxID=1306154 RepID=UPI001AAF189F|nr:HNH/ENDO VII family nuclease [Rummeliibacillus suwonensis]MBO2536949.1 HNH/ENDO VII family nuclease [Rummeliibacillus suwonensis]